MVQRFLLLTSLMIGKADSRIKQSEKAPYYGAFFVVRMVLLGFFLSVSLSACAADSPEVKVGKVIDGDTVKLQDGRTVRLLGINTPEKDHEDRIAEPLSLEATLLLTELVEGQTVRLTKGREEKDKYGRTLGYLDLPDGTDVQEKLISRGYAFVVAFPPDIDRVDRYIKAEKQARDQGKGVWTKAQYAPVTAKGHKKLKSGFGLVTGKVNKVRFSKKNVRLAISEDMVIGIRHAAWKEFWNTDAEKMLGKTVIARGWIRKAEKNKPAYLRVRHPAMLEIK